MPNLSLLPHHGFGNAFCFLDGQFDSVQCCQSPESAIECWADAAFFASCCFTAPIIWQASLSSAIVKLHAPVAYGANQFVAPPCTTGVNIMSFLLSFSANAAKRLASGAERAKYTACSQMGGMLHLVKAWWEEGTIVRNDMFEFCAPDMCKPEDVAASLGPAHFLTVPRKNVGKHGTLSQFFATRDDGSSRESYSRFGTMATAWEQPSPPASHHQIRDYAFSFFRCGRCNLQRYGNSNSDGYLMCELRSNERPYVAAYSYGINGTDMWGEAVSRKLQIPVHQYDCYDTSPPLCYPPCSAVFHDECITGSRARKSRGKFFTLAEHMHMNGHMNVRAGELLLKIDVEGDEWDVFRTVSPLLLNKFRQIIVEFHWPMLGAQADGSRLDVRMSAMRNLLEMFVIVHVHVNNVPPWPYEPCLEVTFANQAFYGRLRRADCRKPVQHKFDAPENPQIDDINVEDLFAAF